MQPHSSTTPFGRRSLSLAQVASHAAAKARSPGKAVHKWHVFRAISSSKARIGVSERALAVLDALLSFHPETTLSGEGLFVFPSNQQLALCGRGIAEATLRQHLAALVNCGLTIRHDSPNGKRFASTGQDGTIEMAFGFDLSPLVARAEQFEAWAEDVLAEERALRRVRERITFCRRDIAKMIATRAEEGVPTRRAGEGPFDWSEIHGIYCGILERVRTRGPLSVDGEIGMPTKRELSPLHCDTYCGFTHDGMIAREIARRLGVARSTIQDNLKPAAAAALGTNPCLYPRDARADRRLHCDIRESSRRTTGHEDHTNSTTPLGGYPP